VILTLGQGPPKSNPTKTTGRKAQATMLAIYSWFTWLIR